MAKKIPNKPLSFVLGKDVPTKVGETQFAQKYEVPELAELMRKKIEEERAEAKEKEEQENSDSSEQEKE